MNALIVFLIVTAVLTPLLRLRARLQPERYDMPVWWWRLRLALRARRRPVRTRPVSAAPYDTMRRRPSRPRPARGECW